MSYRANREAYIFLTKLIQRAGLRRSDFLHRLADYGYPISDDDLTNWGRSGRQFPRNWTLLRAMIAILRDPKLAQPCTVSEALHFFSLVEMPFSELHNIATLFPRQEFIIAIEHYLPFKFIPIEDDYLVVEQSEP
ncbi:MAG: hypothetical protein D6823_01080 [Chloroflexi bacterium]|jgi:hypothetical protein|nr:MAG: hypothetical protein D6823_01080 [Chloroflexota bacterium]